MPTRTFEAIGTRWEITTDREPGPTAWAAVHAAIEDYDRTFSRFRDDSIIARLAREPGSVELPAYAAPLFALYGRLANLTHGAVNPVVGGSLEALGYDAAYSLRPSGAPRPAPRFDDVCVFDGRVLRTTEPVVLDVGAAGKGQLVDLVTYVLVAADVGQVVVDAGGDLRVVGGVEPLRVGLEDPVDASRIVGVLPLHSGALCGSAPNRRRWADGLHHVLDARTGMPVGYDAAGRGGTGGDGTVRDEVGLGVSNDRDPGRAAAASQTGRASAGSPVSGPRTTIAAWASAPTAMVADGAATALFFADPALVAAELGAETLTIDDRRRAVWSTDFDVEVFA